MLDTDDFFCETGDESLQTDGATDDDIEESDWFGVLSPIGDEYFWELYSEDWQAVIEEESNEDGSDDEEWRRPPPINTSGPEWYYE